MLPVLTSGFTEGRAGPLVPIRQYAEDGEYDYESDSDLDDMEVDDDTFEPTESLRDSTCSDTNAEEKRYDDNPECENGLSDKSPGSTGASEQIHQIILPNIAYRT